MPKKKSDGTQVPTVSKDKTAKAKPVDPAALKKLEEMEKKIKEGIIKSLSTNKLILIAPCAILSSRKNNGGKHGNEKAENMGNNG